MPENMPELKERINGQQVGKIIQTYDNSQYITNEAYYQGSNVTILTKTYNGQPDNRIPLPFGRRTVMNIMGYSYKPGYVNYVFENLENKEESIKKIEEIFEENKENIVSAEIYQDALVKGQGAELMWWEGGDTLPQFVQIPREQCIFIYEDTVKEKLKYSIRYYTSKTVDNNGEIVEVRHADVYYPDMIQFYESKSYSQTEEIDPQLTTQRNTTDTNSAYNLIREEPHFFGDVPLYPYDINSDKIGVFQPSIRIIDAIDDMSSDSVVNALGRFNDAILTLSKQLADDVIANIKDYRIMDNMGSREEGNFVEYVNRNIDIGSSIEGIKLYERLYYELTGVPNLSDEKFHAQSGIAIMYALIPFENQISTFEVYFNEGLMYRLQLINNLFNMDLQATIEWKRNLPENIQEKINEVILLKNAGLVSDETLLRRLPEEIVDDVELELEKVKEQREENIAMFENRMDEPMDEEPQPPEKEEEKDEE